MLHQSIKVSLIAGSDCDSVEQLFYLSRVLTRYCLSPILPITLQRHPVHLEDRTISTKRDTVEGLG